MLCAGAAVHAQDRRYGYEAELAATAKQAAVRAGGVDWSCSGTRCTAQGRAGAVSVRGCSALVHAVGPIRRYASEIRQLGKKDLAECNQAASAAAPPGLPKAAAPAAAPEGPTPRAATRRGGTPELTYIGVWPGGREAGAKQ